jgi:hypothetical protein
VRAAQPSAYTPAYSDHRRAVVKRESARRETFIP